MVKSTKGGRMETRKKQLINLPEEHKAWIARVVELAQAEDPNSNQTEVLRLIVGRAMKEDPETFVVKLGKLKLQAYIDDLDKRAAAIQQEKAALVERQMAAGKQQGQPQMAHAR